MQLPGNNYSWSYDGLMQLDDLNTFSNEQSGELYICRLSSCTTRTGIALKG